MTEKDWPAIAEIYKQGIETGNATFEKEIPTWEKWNSGHLPDCRIVVTFDDSVIAWAALTPVSGRCVYAGVAEVSVYVSNKYQGLKIGTKILERLISESEAGGIWTLQAGIFPENKVSIKLHENLGFRIVGVREKIGKMNGIWRDTILLERRSKNIGL
jgi:L-amino acid N-acyltransferase YncA